MVFEKFLKKNLDLKILSLTVATFLWMFVHLTQSASGFGRPQVNLRVPLVVENLAPSLHVIQADHSVSIAVSGVHRSVADLKPSDFKASVDMDGKGPGDFRNLAVHVASPVGTVVTDINPSSVEVMVDEEVDKTVPVTWEFDGNKNPEKISVIPREVVVKGSKRMIERVVAAEIHIPQMILSQAIPEEYTPVPIDVLSRPVGGPSVIPKTVRVITKYSESARPVPIRPNITGKIPVGMELKSVSVDPLVVLLDPGKSGAVPDHLDTMPVDVTDKQGTVTETARLEIPGGAHVYGKPEVRVTVAVGKR